MSTTRFVCHIGCAAGFEKALEGQLAAGEAYSEAITWKKMWSTLRVPSNWLIFMQVGRACCFWEAACCGLFVLVASASGVDMECWRPGRYIHELYHHCTGYISLYRMAVCAPSPERTSGRRWCCAPISTVIKAAVRVAVVLLLQGLFGCLPWGVVQTYINDYLHQQKGLSVELATTVITVFGVGCAFGVIAGGAAGQALYNWWVLCLALSAARCGGLVLGCDYRLCSWKAHAFCGL